MIQTKKTDRRAEVRPWSEADVKASPYMEVGIGPFIRLFDQHFTLDTVRNAELLSY